MFTNGFNSHVFEGDTITCEVDGFTCIATVYHDDTGTTPWERDSLLDGVVSDWTSRSKLPTERLLHSDHGSHRYFDMAAMTKIAREEGFGIHGGPEAAKGMTKRQIAAKAADEQFGIIRSWCRDEWAYCGVAVTVSRNGVELTGQYDHALWGIECNYPNSDNSYLTEVANENLSEALAAARKQLIELSAEAVRTTRIVLEIKGGMLQAVYTENASKIHVVLVDYDNPSVNTVPMEPMTKFTYSAAEDADLSDDDFTQIVHDRVEQDLPT